MMNISITGDRELIERLDSMPGKLKAALLQKVTYFALKLENKVKNEKLSGQVLNVRSGNLRRSIANRVESSGDSVIGKVFSSGDVKYAAIHEYGGTIKHPGGTAYYIGKDKLAHFVSNEVSFKYGNWQRTKPHNINMPERSFMRSSLADMRDEIVSGLHETVVETLKK